MGNLHRLGNRFYGYNLDFTTPDLADLDLGPGVQTTFELVKSGPGGMNFEQPDFRAGNVSGLSILELNLLV